MNRQHLNPVRPAIKTYEARTTKPMLAHPVNGDGRDRVIPGGALVFIHENTTREVYTATAYLGEEPYWAEINPAQFTTYHQ